MASKNISKDTIIDPAKCGIYQIRNLINDKIIVGQTINFPSRWRNHKRELRGNFHHNPHLQKAYHLYGEDNFVLEVIELCSVESLDNLEVFWIKEK